MNIYLCKLRFYFKFWLKNINVIFMKKKVSNGWCLMFLFVKYVDFFYFKWKFGYEIVIDMMIFYFIKFCLFVR